MARALLAREERAAQMKTGPKLTAAIEDRERRIKDFALRTQKAANRLARGRQVSSGEGCREWPWQVSHCQSNWKGTLDARKLQVG